VEFVHGICFSPDSSGNPFLFFLQQKRLQRIAGIGFLKIKKAPIFWTLKDIDLIVSELERTSITLIKCDIINYKKII
jgi:hypothetical protein